MPADRLLVETDAPYLAPVPHRGKPNEPAFVPLVAACLSDGAIPWPTWLWLPLATPVLRWLTPAIA